MSISFKKIRIVYLIRNVLMLFFMYSQKESFMCLSDDSFETKLWGSYPKRKLVFDWEMCKDVADFFAKIVDYKSSLQADIL